MIILGIESSCDETAAAVIKKDGGRWKILSNLVAAQHDVHARFGGVVPELASRRHLENIVPLVQGALTKAGIGFENLNGVAVTSAPGLVGSLLVGIQTAKGIAYAGQIPLVGVNHLEGHLNAAELEYGAIPFPYVGLVVSGGHTSLYFVKSFGDYKLLGATVDDAAGEAFDKTAKLLGLSYPGGPAVEKAAGNGNPSAFKFTRPKFKSTTSMDFSFSGIKTAVLFLCREEAKRGKICDPFTADVAASFQEAVVGILVDDLLEAARIHKTGAVVLAGGVAANRRLRVLLETKAGKAGFQCFIPSFELCTDNAAMIAYVGARRMELGFKDDFTINAVANQEIGI